MAASHADRSVMLEGKPGLVSHIVLLLQWRHHSVYATQDCSNNGSCTAGPHRVNLNLSSTGNNNVAIGAVSVFTTQSAAASCWVSVSSPFLLLSSQQPLLFNRHVRLLLSLHHQPIWCLKWDFSFRHVSDALQHNIPSVSEFRANRIGCRNSWVDLPPSSF